VNAHDTCTRQSCLFQAITLNNPNLVKRLLDCKADVTWRDRQHHNVWHKCAFIPEHTWSFAKLESDLDRAIFCNHEVSMDGPDHNSSNVNFGDSYTNNMLSAPRRGGCDSRVSLDNSQIGCALVLFSYSSTRAQVEWLDVEGHNAAYWAKQLAKKHLLKFLQQRYGSEPHRWSSKQSLEMMENALASATKKKPKGGKSAKNK